MTDETPLFIPSSTAGMTREEAERVAYQFRVDAYNARIGLGRPADPAPTNVVMLADFRARHPQTGDR